MNKTLPYLAMTAAALIPISGAAWPGPTATEILKKSQAIVDSAKTYQATILMTNNAGSMGTVTSRMDIKTAGKKSALVTTIIGKPTGQMAFAAMGSGARVVDDGQTMTIYNPAMKMYFKQPSTGRQPGLAQFKDLAKISKDANITLAGTENVAGKPAYVIQITPKKKTPGGPEKLTLYVEQGSYHLRAMVMKTNVRSGPQKQMQPVTTRLQVQNEKFNEPISESEFRFVPPPGSKEMTPGMMGGAPGGPGGFGGPRKGAVPPRRP